MNPAADAVRIAAGPLGLDALLTPAGGGEAKLLRILRRPAQQQDTGESVGEYAEIRIPRQSLAKAGLSPDIGLGIALPALRETWIYRPNDQVQIQRRDLGGFIALRCRRGVLPTLRR